jgi:uncharacterized iron-regulated protein
MAEVLSVQQMLADTFEPKRKFRWILAINGIDAFTAKTASRPQVVFDETVVEYINQKRYLSGKGTWQQLKLTLYDPIVPSASQKVMEWIRLNWENVTGRMGYAQFYKKTINLKLLDPVGAIVEDWELQGTWIQDSNFGELDYSVSDPTEIALVLRFDQGVLLY